MKIERRTGLNFSDVYIIPQYSEVSTRTKVNVGVKVGSLNLKVPVISANMDTVTDGKLAKKMFEAGAVGAIHRSMSIDDNGAEYNSAAARGEAFVSVGVNESSKDRATSLYGRGARYFVIDIAHGHSLKMKEMITWMRKELGDDVYIMAGNVATLEGVLALSDWGANAAKVGIGPGAVCLTKNVTGVTVPQFTAIQNCATVKDTDWLDPEFLIVADGGVREIGDIAKAIGAGADLVMCGRMFAGCQEAPGTYVNGKKVYRGMASLGAMRVLRNESDASQLPTPEGTQTLVEEEGTVEEVVRHIRGGLQSAFSYTGATNMKDFQEKVKFGIRK